MQHNSAMETCTILPPCVRRLTFLGTAPQVWNSLSQERRNCETLGSCKKDPKSYSFYWDMN